MLLGAAVVSQKTWEEEAEEEEQAASVGAADAGAATSPKSGSGSAKADSHGIKRVDPPPGLPQSVDPNSEFHRAALASQHAVDDPGRLKHLSARGRIWIRSDKASRSRKGKGARFVPSMVAAALRRICDVALTGVQARVQALAEYADRSKNPADALRAEHAIKQLLPDCRPGLGLQAPTGDAAADLLLTLEPEEAVFLAALPDCNLPPSPLNFHRLHPIVRDAVLRAAMPRSARLSDVPPLRPLEPATPDRVLRQRWLVHSESRTISQVPSQLAGHIIVGGTLTSLLDLVRPLRRVTSQVVVVLAPRNILAPQVETAESRQFQRIRRLFKGILHVDGSPLRPRDLVRAGIQRAGCVLILSSDGGLDSEGSSDGQATSADHADTSMAEASRDLGALYTASTVLLFAKERERDLDQRRRTRRAQQLEAKLAAQQERSWQALAALSDGAQQGALATLALGLHSAQGVVKSVRQAKALSAAGMWPVAAARVGGPVRFGPSPPPGVRPRFASGGSSMDGGSGGGEDLGVATDRQQPQGGATVPRTMSGLRRMAQGMPATPTEMAPLGPRGVAGRRSSLISSTPSFAIGTSAAHKSFFVGTRSPFSLSAAEGEGMRIAAGSEAGGLTPTPGPASFGSPGRRNLARLSLPAHALDKMPGLVLSPVGVADEDVDESQLVSHAHHLHRAVMEARNTLTAPTEAGTLSRHRSMRTMAIMATGAADGLQPQARGFGDAPHSLNAATGQALGRKSQVLGRIGAAGEPSVASSSTNSHQASEFSEAAAAVVGMGTTDSFNHGSTGSFASMDDAGASRQLGLRINVATHEDSEGAEAAQSARVSDMAATTGSHRSKSSSGERGGQDRDTPGNRSREAVPGGTVKGLSKRDSRKRRSSSAVRAEFVARPTDASESLVGATPRVMIELADDSSIRFLSSTMQHPVVAQRRRNVRAAMLRAKAAEFQLPPNDDEGRASANYLNEEIATALEEAGMGNPGQMAGSRAIDEDVSFVAEAARLKPLFASGRVFLGAMLDSLATGLLFNPLLMRLVTQLLYGASSPGATRTASGVSDPRLAPGMQVIVRTSASPLVQEDVIRAMRRDEAERTAAASGQVDTPRSVLGLVPPRPVSDRHLRPAGLDGFPANRVAHIPGAPPQQLTRPQAAISAPATLPVSQQRGLGTSPRRSLHTPAPPPRQPQPRSPPGLSKISVPSTDAKASVDSPTGRATPPAPPRKPPAPIRQHRTVQPAAGTTAVVRSSPLVPNPVWTPPEQSPGIAGSTSHHGERANGDPRSATRPASRSAADDTMARSGSIRRPSFDGSLGSAMPSTPRSASHFTSGGEEPDRGSFVASTSASVPGQPRTKLKVNKWQFKQHDYVRQLMVPESFHGRRFHSLFHFLVVEHRMMPLALFRSAEAMGAPAPYVVTNPRPDLRMHRLDRVFVLCGMEHVNPSQREFREGPCLDAGADRQAGDCMRGTPTAPHPSDGSTLPGGVGPASCRPGGTTSGPTTSHVLSELGTGPPQKPRGVSGVEGMRVGGSAASSGLSEVLPSGLSGASADSGRKPAAEEPSLGLLVASPTTGMSQPSQQQQPHKPPMSSRAAAASPLQLLARIGGVAMSNQRSPVLRQAASSPGGAGWAGRAPRRSLTEGSLLTIAGGSGRGESDTHPPGALARGRSADSTVVADGIQLSRPHSNPEITSSGKSNHAMESENGMSSELINDSFATIDSMATGGSPGVLSSSDAQSFPGDTRRDRTQPGNEPPPAHFAELSMPQDAQPQHARSAGDQATGLGTIRIKSAARPTLTPVTAHPAPAVDTHEHLASACLTQVTHTAAQSAEVVALDDAGSSGAGGTGGTAVEDHGAAATSDASGSRSASGDGGGSGSSPPAAGRRQHPSSHRDDSWIRDQGASRGRADERVELKRPSTVRSIAMSYVTPFPPTLPPASTDAAGDVSSAAGPAVAVDSGVGTGDLSTGGNRTQALASATQLGLRDQSASSLLASVAEEDPPSSSATNLAAAASSRAEERHSHARRDNDDIALSSSVAIGGSGVGHGRRQQRHSTGMGALTPLSGDRADSGPARRAQAVPEPIASGSAHAIAPDRGGPLLSRSASDSQRVTTSGFSQLTGADAGVFPGSRASPTSDGDISRATPLQAGGSPPPRPATSPKSARLRSGGKFKRAPAGVALPPHLATAHASNVIPPKPSSGPSQQAGQSSTSAFLATGEPASTLPAGSIDGRGLSDGGTMPGSREAAAAVPARTPSHSLGHSRWVLPVGVTAASDEMSSPSAGTETAAHVPGESPRAGFASAQSQDTFGQGMPKEVGGLSRGLDGDGKGNHFVADMPKHLLGKESGLESLVRRDSEPAGVTMSNRSSDEEGASPASARPAVRANSSQEWHGRLRPSGKEPHQRAGASASGSTPAMAGALSGRSRSQRSRGAVSFVLDAAEAAAGATGGGGNVTPSAYGSSGAASVASFAVSSVSSAEDSGAPGTPSLSSPEHRPAGRRASASGASTEDLALDGVSLVLSTAPHSPRAAATALPLPESQPVVAEPFRAAAGTATPPRPSGLMLRTSASFVRGKAGSASPSSDAGASAVSPAGVAAPPTVVAGPGASGSQRQPQHGSSGSSLQRVRVSFRPSAKKS